MWFLWLLCSSFLRQSLTGYSELASNTVILLPQLPVLGFQACMTLPGFSVCLFEYSILIIHNLLHCEVTMLIAKSYTSLWGGVCVAEIMPC